MSEGQTPNGHLSLSGDESELLHGYFDKLADGGTHRRAQLEKAPWGDEFGQVKDKFGVNWLVNISGACYADVAVDVDPAARAALEPAALVQPARAPARSYVAWNSTSPVSSSGPPSTTSSTLSPVQVSAGSGSRGVRPGARVPGAEHVVEVAHGVRRVARAHQLLGGHRLGRRRCSRPQQAS